MATKGLLNWSTTAATNATADSQAQFAEGQAPSSLNDGIRGLMSSMALYRNDISGSITTGGTSTAYTATMGQDVASLAALDKQVITIVPHATNGADPTLAIGVLSAKNIRTATGVNVASGVMVAGTPYQLVYFSSVGEFILMGFTNDPFNVPVGAFLPFSSITAPNSNFVLPAGQAISRTTYSVYFAMVGTTFGVGNGSTTFNIPNIEGRVIACKETSATLLTTGGSGIDGATLGATGGAQSITLDTTMIPSHTHTGTTDAGGAHAHNILGGTGSLFNTTTFNDAATDGICGANSSTSDSAVAGFVASSSTHTHPFTSAATGGGLAHRNVQPTIVLPYILRII